MGVLFALCYGALKRFFNLGSIEAFADKNELARSRFVFLPEPIPKDGEAIVHPMEYGAPRVAGDRRNVVQARHGAPHDGVESRNA